MNGKTRKSIASESEFRLSEDRISRLQDILQKAPSSTPPMLRKLPTKYRNIALVISAIIVGTVSGYQAIKDIIP